MPSMGAKSATVMACPRSTMPKYAVPTPTRAVAMGSMEAASEPNARKRTTAATATPTISAVCPPDALVREMAVPPSSTSSPLASADFAASTTAWTSPLSRFSARSAKVTVAYAVRPSWLIRPDPWCVYGLSTEATPGASRSCPGRGSSTVRRRRSARCPNRCARQRCHCRRRGRGSRCSGAASRGPIRCRGPRSRWSTRSPSRQRPRSHRRRREARAVRRRGGAGRTTVQGLPRASSLGDLWIFIGNCPQRTHD